MRLFLYLSEILNKEVVDINNQFVGYLCDISMLVNDEVFPRAEFLTLRRGLLSKTYARVSFRQIQRIGKNFQLNIDVDDVIFRRDIEPQGFSLCHNILDQQVVDMDGQKVVRVNDIHLLRVDNQIYLAHVDVGLRGLVRRLEWTKTVDWLVRIVKPKAAYLSHEELISWRNIHLLSVGQSSGNILQSENARKRLAKIPAAELADIMEDLDMFEKVSLFKTFGVDLQRRIFTDMTPQEKGELIDQLTDSDAGNLLENIPADEATDLLHNLPKEKTMQLLRFMHTRTSKQLRKLLGFEQDSAGGLMTMEYLYLPKEALVKDAIQKIKDNAEYPGNIFFIYILDEESRLVGTTSLRRFINTDPESPLIDTCYNKKVFVRTDDVIEEVALLLEKYKFSSIPVLNEDNVMQGVITSDDVMEELISLAWRKYKDQL